MQQLNQLLFIGIMVCAVALVLEARSGVALINQSVDFSAQAKGPVKASEVTFPIAKDARYYLDQVNGRNIFKPYDAQAVKTASGSVTLANRLSKYKLVGVAWLDLPETASVMIEDTQTKQTYFLKQGEQLEGVTVKTIYTDRAVFSYEHEETTIKL